MGVVPPDPDLDRGWGRETREWDGDRAVGVGAGHGLGFDRGGVMEE